MLEELIASSPIPPVPLLAGLLSGLVCLWLGWTIKGMGARRRENALKQEVLAAKASVPQLESNLRNREQQLERLQEQVKDLNKDNAEQASQREAAERELRTAQRQVTNLTSEVNAVKGVSKDADSMVIDGFDDETAHEAEDESPVVARLKKTEAAYEKLKAALIKRDDRILALEDQLAAKPVGAAADNENGDFAAEATALKTQVKNQLETIGELESQVADLRQDKEMLEELANRRSKSNRALKEASAEIQGQVPALQQEIEQQLQTVKDREASISRLLKEVETVKFDLSAEQGESQRLREEVDLKNQSLEAALAQVDAHNSLLEEREARIAEIDAQLSASREEIINLQRVITVADQRIDGLQEKADQLEQVTRQRAELEEVVANRNQQLGTLQADIDRLLAAEIEAKEAARTAAAEIKRFELEVEDLKAGLAQQERWTEKLKGSLQERDAKNEALGRSLEGLKSKLASADAELEYQRTEQQMLESDKRHLEEEIKSARDRAEHAGAALAEAEFKLAKAELAGQTVEQAPEEAPSSPLPESTGQSTEPQPNGAADKAGSPRRVGASASAKRFGGVPRARNARVKRPQTLARRSAAFLRERQAKARRRSSRRRTPSPLSGLARTRFGYAG